MPAGIIEGGNLEQPAANGIAKAHRIDHPLSAALHILHAHKASVLDERAQRTGYVGIIDLKAPAVQHADGDAVRKADKPAERIDDIGRAEGRERHREREQGEQQRKTVETPFQRGDDTAAGGINGNAFGEDGGAGFRQPIADPGERGQGAEPIAKSGHRASSPQEQGQSPPPSQPRTQSPSPSWR